MLEPSKVKEAFKKVADDNYSFRIYLKNHVDVAELDEQFLELHNELFLGYDCSKCRNCCKEYSACFEEEELNSVAAFLEITEAEFKDMYIKEKFGEYQLNVKPCCFLEADGGCKIEACKPSSCRDYPFTNRPERLFSLLSIIESASVCPVVYEMIERLKQIYGFKRRKRYY
jgi:Fe-S-cluster containining protein